jgi:IS30 family transposase
MNAQGYSRKSICEVIGKDKSVLSRELRRNSDSRNRVYKSDLAQKKYEKRQSEKPKKQYFTSVIQEQAEAGLKSYLSPEQIVGLAKKKNDACVSVERIYQHVWADKKKGGELHTYLRSKGKKYCSRGQYKDKRGQIIDRIGIENRPEIVEKRERFGDLEIDTIIGKNHQGAIVTINDRATGCLRMKRLDSKEAEPLKEATITLLEEWKPFLNTITADNGKEFAAHKGISEALEVDFFFARPYHSWERGSNENLNGLIRQFTPKKTDFSELTDEFIKQVEDILNNRPRKRYNYETPNEKFNQLINNKVAFKT